MRRYDQLLLLINQHKPQSIIEIGTHAGERAEKMILRALAHNKEVAYFGYDVFDTKTPEFHRTVLNGKGIPQYKKVVGRMESIRRRYPGFNYQLIVGDTRETLHHGTHDASPLIYSDFVFIDGDHRVETIRGDYHAVKGNDVVVFDDYYRLDSNGVMPDTKQYGCNQIIDNEINQTNRNIVILPDFDQLPTNDLVPGGRVYLAAVVRKD